ncbi:hypothetical protein ES703_30487 [subsurface metagenome]
MIPIEYDLGKEVVDSCTCECGAALSLPWGGSWGINSFVLKCAADPSHDKVVPVKSFYQMWKDGEELPSFIQDAIERKQRRKIMEQNDVKAMVVKQDADKLSTYVKAKFPQDLVSPQAALDFAKWCIAHQLEPIRDCVPYHGNPFITVEWLDRQASADDKFKGYSYKVFSPQDKESLDFDPKDMVVECQADWEGLEKPLVGLGVVTRAEREARTGGELDEVTAKGYRAPVVHLHPQKLLFKRARAAAFKQRYHIPAPILEELPYTTVIEAEYTVKEASKGGEKIGGLGGEEETKSPEDVTEDDVPDMNAVFRICFHFWEMQPVEVCGQLGYKTVIDLASAGVKPWDAWLTIKSLKQPK